MTPNIVSIPFSSPNYPLPDDYNHLTSNGRREARVNGCRQWLIDGTADERAARLIGSTLLFDSHYLWPSADEDWDPLFYDMPPLPTPRFHHDLSQLWASYPRSVALAPRGSAKSSRLAKDIMLRLVSCQAHSHYYITSTQDNAETFGQRCKDQCYENSRINDDFAPAYGLERLKPRRSVRPTGVEKFFLSNGSNLRSISISTRLRGGRPVLISIDDPEYDPRGSTNLAQVRSDMEHLLFRILLQMVSRAHTGIRWVGTFVSKRHYLYHAMSVSVAQDGTTRAQDPRFDSWARLLIDACYENPETGKLESCWPHMWPSDREEAIRLGNPAAFTLQDMIQSWGLPVFNAEMRGRPGEASETFFKLDSSPRGRHAYWYTDADDLLLSAPTASTASINWLSKDGTVRTRKLADFLREVSLFTTVDTAYTENASSDRRCSTLMALTPENELFVLDMWSDRKADQILLTKTLQMAQLWKCPIIGIEVVKESFKTFKYFEAAIRTRLTADMGLTHVPGVKALRPGTMSKSSKIEALDFRFNHGLIKLPLFARTLKPWWGRLLDQIEGFNPEADNGGLEKDDEIDTVSMSLLVIRGKLARRQAKENVTPLDINAEIQKGNLNLPGTRIPIMSGAPLEFLSPATVAHLFHPRKVPSNASRV